MGSGVFCKSTVLLESSSASSKDEVDGDGASESAKARARQTTLASNAAAVKMPTQVQRYKDRCALVDGYVNESKKIFSQALASILENLKNLSEVHTETETMRSDLKTFVTQS
jgi:hypothetical protein